MTYENLLVDARDGIALLTLNRPAKSNALEAQEAEAALFSELVATADTRAGTRALLEKRPARFAGR